MNLVLARFGLGEARVLQGVGDVQLLPIDTRSTATRAGWVTRLDHEVLNWWRVVRDREVNVMDIGSYGNNTVEDHSIIIPPLRELSKVFACLLHTQVN